jgi:ribulose 1,5-bisphosphate synthetase/thiazole synthase
MVDLLGKFWTPVLYQADLGLSAATLKVANIIVTVIEKAAVLGGGSSGGGGGGSDVVRRSAALHSLADCV